MPETLEHARLWQLVQAAADRLQGDWLLVGGALVTLWLEPRRTTEDVDLIGMAGTQEERWQLMQLADELGLPVESVNSAADYFVRRIPDWRQQLEEFHRGATATIYRPNPTLFLRLKLARLSEQDLQDCQALLRRVKAEKWETNAELVVQSIHALPSSQDKRLSKRRAHLMHLLDGLRS